MLAITLKSDMLTGATNHSGLLGSGLRYIIDSSGNIVTADAVRSKIPDIPFSRLPSGKTITYAGSGGKMLVVTFDSQYPSWKYVFCVPVSTILQKVQFVRALIASGVLLCLLAGGLTAVFVARRNYRPVSDLIKAVSENKAAVPLHADNEFSLIRESFARSYEKYQEAVRRLDLQETDLRQDFLTRLMKGTLQGTPAFFWKAIGSNFAPTVFSSFCFTYRTTATWTSPAGRSGKRAGWSLPALRSSTWSVSCWEKRTRLTSRMWTACLAAW